MIYILIWRRVNGKPFFIIILQLNTSTTLGALLFQQTTVLDREACIRQMGVYGSRVHQSTVCTSNRRDRGLCTGDIGGPLITRNSNTNTNTVIGLASWHTECGDGRPDVYTRVFSHMEFIRNAISN